MGTRLLKSLIPLYNVFAFIITPVNSNYKSIVAHVYFTTHSNFGKDIKDIIDII